MRGAKREPHNHVAAGFCRQKFRKTNPEPRQTRRPREEVKLGNYAWTTRKPLRSAFWTSGMWNLSEMTMGCHWADLGRKRRDPAASWLQGHR